MVTALSLPLDASVSHCAGLCASLVWPMPTYMASGEEISGLMATTRMPDALDQATLTEGSRVVRVDDDGVHALVHEVAHGADLALHVDVRALDHHLAVDALVLPRLRGRLGLLNPFAPTQLFDRPLL